MSGLYEIYTDDECVNYTFGISDEPETDIAHCRQEWIPTAMIDYCIDKDGKIPLSFAALSSCEDPTAAAETWYADHCPGFTQEICGILARARFPAKKIAKDKSDDPVFNIVKGLQTVYFD